MKHHFVTGLDPGNQFADFAHNTGNVVAKYVRQRNLNSRQAPARPHVEVIQSAGFNFNQNFVRFDSWIRRVGVLQHLWPTMLVEDDSFHKIILPRIHADSRG